jgi:ribosomal protein S18 acetylase RimI-like enzyme
MILRPYQPGDLLAVTHFVGACWQRDKSTNYHPGDFVHWMSNGYRGERLEHYFHIVEESGRIRAVVVLDADSGSYAPVIDARRRGGAWELELHRACIAVMVERLQTKERKSVTVNLVADDEAGRDCLTRLGFEAQKADHAVIKRSLGSIPDARLPNGFDIRGVAGEHEAGLVADVHNGAFAPKWTADEYLKVMRTPGFELGRELVVVTPDGRFAAFAVIWLDPISRSGLFEPVGCHSDFTRRGLTKALMFAGMARMREGGMETAVVGYEVTNEAAFKLYGSVGFGAYFETVDYALALRPSS